MIWDDIYNLVCLKQTMVTDNCGSTHNLHLRMKCSCILITKYKCDSSLSKEMHRSLIAKERSKQGKSVYNSCKWKYVTFTMFVHKVTCMYFYHASQSSDELHIIHFSDKKTLNNVAKLCLFKVQNSEFKVATINLAITASNTVWQGHSCFYTTLIVSMQQHANPNMVKSFFSRN